jgi:DNA-binding IclR family transcriptional regulator
MNARKPEANKDQPRKKVRVKNRRRSVQVIERAALILRSLEGHPEGLSLGEIAKGVALPRSTVQRIIDALETERFVIAASPTARVRLGPGLVSLGSAAKVDIEKIIHPYLRRLSQELNETVDLSILDGTSMVLIDQVQADAQRLQAVSSIGLAFPVHCCANGKAILARMDRETIRLLLGDSIQKVTSNTVATIAALNRELDRVRSEGCAFDREEHTLGVCAVGAAINDPFGRNLAISIPVPAVRFYGNEAHLVSVLSGYCRSIEKALGQIT